MGGYRAPSGTQHLGQYQAQGQSAGVVQGFNPRSLDSWLLRCSTLDLYQLVGLRASGVESVVYAQRA